MDPPLFIKKHLHLPISNKLEYLIGKQLRFNWAVRPLGMTKEGGIVFPFVDGTPAENYTPKNRHEREVISNEIIDIAHQLSTCKIILPQCRLLPTNEPISLANLIDFNPNNILIDHKSGGSELRLIDFEAHSNHNSWRNKIHLGKMLFKLGTHPMLAIKEYVTGYIQGAYHLATYQFASVETRISNRQPSLASLIVAFFRSHIGNLISHFLPSKQP